jgi:protein-disulfide isomerase
VPRADESGQTFQVDSSMTRRAGVALIICLVASAGGQSWTMWKIRSLEMRLDQPVRRTDAPVRRDPIAAFEATLDLRGRAIRGASSAKVAILEFGDYQCSFCRRFHQEIWPLIERQFVSSGKALFAYRHMPLSGLQRGAQQAAVAAECAGKQNQLWGMHDLLLANALDLHRSGFEARAFALPLNHAAFSDCISQGHATDVVDADIREANNLGIRGTPTFLIGTVSGDRVRVVKRVSGTQPFGTFVKLIEDLLTTQ